jgi:SAM-dependent methyltransferase
MLHALGVALAKAYLKLAPAYGAPRNLPTVEAKVERAMARARVAYEDERKGGLLKFFDADLDLSGDVILDLGSGYGGRTIAFQRLTGARALGLDVSDKMAAAACRFARSEGVDDAHFMTGVAEALPLASDSVDVIFSYDVLEHVQVPETCLRECWRVLKPGGRLLLVFPPYYHPTGSHLEGYVSHVPYANAAFPSSVLVAAVDEILAERGDTRQRTLRPGDKLYWLNGLTIGGFRELLGRVDFQVVSFDLLPLFSRLNRKYDAWRMKYYAWVFTALRSVPFVQEYFTHRVVAVLRKPASPGPAR